MEVGKDIIQVLAEVAGGEAIVMINERLDEAVKSVDETGEKATLTIKLVVNPEKRKMSGGVRTVLIDVTCELKKPALQPGGAIFFVSDDGHLTRDDPQQSKLFDSTEVK